MKPNKLLARLLFGLVLGGFAVSQSLAGSAMDSFSGDRVTVDSSKSFDQVNDSIQKLVAKNGMMIMAKVDQGKMLSMTGLELKATLYLIGNPTVGKKLFQETHEVGLYVPLRVFVYSDDAGKTHISYDKPSALLSQFHSKKIGMVAKKLDEKLHGLSTMAAR